MSTNVVALKAGGQIAGIVPQSFEDVYRVARCISESGLAPTGMQTPEQVTVAIMTGLELGLPPMFAIQKIAVINGRPALWGDAIPALLWARGFKLHEWFEGSDDESLIAHCEVTRPDGEKIKRSFGSADAKAAGLWQTQAKVKRKGKDGSWYEKDNDSPWFRFKRRMLQMRARGYASRDGAADALSGLYLAEELDEPMRDVTPAKSTPLEIPDDIPDIKSGANGAKAAEIGAKEPDTEPDNQDELADPEGFIAKLADDLALCSSVEELDEIKQHNAELIERLPKAHKAKAQQMIEEASP